MHSSNGSKPKQNNQGLKIMNNEQIKYLDNIRNRSELSVSGEAIAAMILEFYNLTEIDSMKSKAENAVMKMIKEEGTQLSTIKAQLRLRKYFNYMLANDGKAFENLVTSMTQKGLITVDTVKAYKA